MRRLRQYIVLITMTVLIAVVTTGYSSLIRNMDKWNIDIKTTYGDITNIHNLEITGKIIDTNTVTNFNIDMNGELNIDNQIKTNAEFRLYTEWNERYKDIEYYSNGNFYYTKDNIFILHRSPFDYLIDDGVNDVNVELTKNRNPLGGRSENVIIPTTITTLDKQAKMKCMVEINGILYFVIPTKGSNGGSTGLYKVTKFSKTTKDDYNDNYSKLIDIELENKRNVVGLYPIGSKLVIVVKEDNGYIMKLYDTVSGLIVNDINADLPSEIEDIKYFSHDNRLTLYINKESLYTYEVTSGLKELGKFDFNVAQDLIGEKTYAEDVIYKDGRYYMVVQHIRYVGISANKKVKKLTLELLSYNSEQQLVYRGEIVTDINDDFIRWNIMNDWNLDETHRVENRSYGSIELH